MKNRLILVNDLYGARLTQALRPCATDDVVAFSVASKVELDRIGINSVYPESLVNLPDFNLLGTQNINRVKNISHIIDQELRLRIGYFREFDLRICEYAHFYVKILFDMFYSTYYILEAISNQGNYNEFKYVFCRNKSVFRIEHKVILMLFNELFLTGNNKSEAEDSNYFRSPSFCLINARNILKKCSLILKSMLSRARTGKRILLFDLAHDIPYFKNKVFRDYTYIDFNWNVSKISRTIIKHRNKQSWSRQEDYYFVIKEVFLSLSKRSSYKAMFDLKDNVFLLLHALLEEEMLTGLASRLQYFIAYRDDLLSIKPQVCLMSNCRFDIENAFKFSIVKSIGIPMVTYQEGGGAGYILWPGFNIDIRLSDYFLSYGKGVSESNFIEKSRAKIIPVGSIRLASLLNFHKQWIHRSPKTIAVSILSQRPINTKSRPKNNKNVSIMFIADNIKDTIFQHYPGNGGFFSLAYQRQLDLLNRLLTVKGVKVILKTTKRIAPHFRVFRKLVKIETSPLERVLGQADAFLLEYPSTVLLECLLTDKPLAILFDRGDVVFEDRAFELLSRRARMCSNKEEFSEIMKFILKDIAEGSQMTQEKGFLQRYCLASGSEQRVLEFLNKLII